MKDIERFEFVENEGFRLRINPRKAGNSLVLEAVLTTLKNNGYSFYRLFAGGYIFAEKR